MIESNRCPRCGGPLPKNGMLGGGCPRCMLELGYETKSESAKDESTAAHPKSIGRYRILRVIGEGGMGIVYEAEQDQPRRTVALKIIKRGMSSPELLRRFEQESEALGRLQHPGIAQIYEAGTVDTGFGPQPYFAMELIHGSSPREFAEAHHLGTRERLEIMEKICDAIHHAHQRGLIHRDLKPGNILIDETGQPKILDFGVARVTDSDVRATLETDLGQLVGTLAYMSPEQALADPLDIDTRSDVYSLGVILYELLAGRLPYTISKNLHESIQAIREEDPARLSSVNRTYRGDIETIVAKALEKDRARRYSSASEMAADIKRYLSDEPIVARPPSASYRLQKFTRRHRALVAGVAAVFIVLVGGIVASTSQVLRANYEQVRATSAEQTAEASRDAALIAKKQAQTAEQAATMAKNQAIGEQQRADVAVTAIINQHLLVVSQTMARESVRQSANRLNDDLAALLARQAMLFQARTPNQPQSLVEDALQQAARPTPWGHDILQRDDADAFYSLAISPNGNRLATVATNAVDRNDVSLRLWDLRDLDAPPILLQTHQDPVSFVKFSPDSAHLISVSSPSSDSGDSAVKMWDLRTPGKAPIRLSGNDGSVSSLAFSSDGARIASGGVDGVWLWDLRHSAAPSVLLQGSQELPGYPPFVVFSRDGTHLASNGRVGIKLWDLRNPGAPPVWVQGLTISPDGARVATPTPEGIWISDLSNLTAPPILLQGSQSREAGAPSATSGGSPVSQDVQGKGLTPSVAFSPDGGYLVSFSKAIQGEVRDVRLWDLRNSSGPPVRLKNAVQISSLTFLPDGATLVSGGADGVRLWNLRNLDISPVVLHGPDSNSVIFSPDGSRVIALHNKGKSGDDIRVWDIRNQSVPPVRLLQDAEGPQQYGTSVAISPDGTSLASGGADKTVRLWNLRNLSAPPALLRGPQGGTKTVAFSPDGTRFASGGEDGAWIWNLRNSAAPPMRFQGSKSTVQSVAFSPDGSRLALSGNNLADNTVQIWDLRSPSVVFASLHAISPLAFSPDGMRLASGSLLQDENVRIWDLHNLSATPVVLPQSSDLPVLSIAFSPDGGHLATGNPDGTVRLWNLRKPGTQPTVLPGSHTIRSVAFSRDGSRLAASGSDGIRLWDLRNLSAPSVLFPSPVPAFSVAFSPDGTRLAYGGDDGSVRVTPLWSTTADYLCTRVWRNLSTAEWRLYVGEGIPYERTCPALPPGVGATR